MGAVEQVVITGAGTELAQRLTEDRVPVHTVGWRIGLDPRVVPAVIAQIRKGGALLHAHDAHAVTLADLSARRTATPFVATRRVDFHLRHPGAWKRARRVIAISRAVSDVLLADGISANQITIIPSGISLEDVAPSLPSGSEVSSA